MNQVLLEGYIIDHPTFGYDENGILSCQFLVNVNDTIIPIMIINQRLINKAKNEISKRYSILIYGHLSTNIINSELRLLVKVDKFVVNV